jgi:hypothetical protein
MDYDSGACIYLHKLQKDVRMQILSAYKMNSALSIFVKIVQSKRNIMKNNKYD